MATHDYVINNDTAANVRADINNALAAIRSSNLSATEPANLYAGLFWFDTTNDELKLRNEANDGWIVMGKFSGNSNTSDTPSGAILQFAGSSAPSNWLLCDGALVSRTTYATLFGVVGTNYGAGDGSSTFKLPGPCVGVCRLGLVKQQVWIQMGNPLQIACHRGIGRRRDAHPYSFSDAISQPRHSSL
jgi:hypothetical protein